MNQGHMTAKRIAQQMNVIVTPELDKFLNEFLQPAH